jgi:threonine synthase
LHQLEWEAPDWILVPGGNLGTFTACGKALHELKTAGFITRIPRLAVIRPEGAPSFCGQSAIERTSGDAFSTRASALSINNPAHAVEACWYLDHTNGMSVEVTETEIAVAKHAIGKDGIGSDPSSAVTVAGCRKMCRGGMVTATPMSTIQPDESVVCLLTGNLMNDPDYTLDFHEDSLYLNPVRTTTLIPGKRITTLCKFNRIHRMPADSNKVIEHIEHICRI